MAFAYEPLHLLLLLAFSTHLPPISTTSTSTTPLASTPTTLTTKPQRLVSKLIHPGSVHHPHYNPNETTRDRMELHIQHSAARLAYIQARIEGSLGSNGYKSNISPSLNGRTILANLSIGQPPIPQLLIVDTGSDILWVMCTPCSNCDHHPGVLFDPSKSSTYYPLCNRLCSSKGCKCDLSDQSTYNITYADNSFSSGTFGHDMLVFDTIDEGTTQVSNVMFGCGHNMRYNSDPWYNGILGLNNGLESLASQIGQKFSYCIGNLADKNYNYNQLILGEGADLEGYFTHFEVHKDFYYINMEGISIGEKRLDIDPSMFEIKENGTGGVIIDSGCTMTYLVNDVHELLDKEVRNLLGGSFRQVQVENTPWLLCYYGTISRDLLGFPVITFHFAGEADLTMDSTSFFHQSEDNVFCMAVGPSSASGTGGEVSLLGLLAQQSYNVGYDLVNQFIYFQRIDCQLLID
ncbi:hypothetical protein RJT34_14842 [Clitoria ternatea]|uniref:Peptidase A1 domain-containing protein n=1 Tax=Clitoria ternatea TaxID=43366 RepID=A0AAN9JRN1_CLITE